MRGVGGLLRFLANIRRLIAGRLMVRGLEQIDRLQAENVLNGSLHLGMQEIVVTKFQNHILFAMNG